MHAYNVNQGTYDFFSEFQSTPPSSSPEPSFFLTPIKKLPPHHHQRATSSSYSNQTAKTKSLTRRNQNHHHQSSSLYRRPFNRADSELDDFDTQAVRFKPESLDNLVKLTKFDKRELKLMYRGFKQLCPSGVVKEDKFKLIYAQFFPRGADTNGYARFVFNSFDQQRKQEITFTDFVIGLSVLTRGTIDERLKWVFTLYDLNGDGQITREELTKIVNSVHDLMGKFALSPAQAVALEAAQRTGSNNNNNSAADIPLNININTTTSNAGGKHNSSNATSGHEEQADYLFRKFDLNNDGIITLDEFLEACHKDDNIIKSISVFNTVF